MITSDTALAATQTAKQKVLSMSLSMSLSLGIHPGKNQHLGIDAAIERSHRYAEAGADVCFLESPESAEEMRLLNQQVKIPTLANLIEGGRTPMLPIDQLTALGSSAAFSDRMVDHRTLWNHFEYPAFMELESRYVEPTPAESSTKPPG